MKFYLFVIKYKKAKMFLYAIRPLFADIHKVGLWSSDPISLQGRYCTPYGDHDTIYINIGDDETRLKEEESKLHHYLKKKGVWRYGEIFDYSPDLLITYCSDRNFVLTYGTYRMRRPRVQVAKECWGPSDLLVMYLNHKDGKEPESEHMKERLLFFNDLLSYLKLNTICDFDRFYSQEEAQILAEGIRGQNGPMLFTNYNHACSLFCIRRKQPESFKIRDGNEIEEGSYHYQADEGLIWNHHSFFRVVNRFLSAAGLGVINSSQRRQENSVRRRFTQYMLHKSKIVNTICGLEKDSRLRDNTYYQSLLRRCNSEAQHLH